MTMMLRARPAASGIGTRRARRSTVASAMFAVALVAAGCGDDDGDAAEPGTTTSAGGTVAPGTTAPEDEGCTADTPKADLTMGTFTEAVSLDPTLSRGTGVTGGTELISIYDTLMRWNPETEEYEPRIAESVEPNAAFTTWTLKLRDDVSFGNGDKFTSAEVKASIERFQAPDSKSRWAALSRNIKSMATPDPLTVVFTLTDPWATFPYLMAHEVGMIVNPKVVQAMGVDAFGKLPTGAGAGAFEPVSFATGEGITMQGKDDYWGGPVCIEQLKFVTIAGAPGTYDAFRNGELDVAWMRDAKVLAQAKDDGVEFAETLQNGGAGVMMNMKSLSDVKVRMAAAHAIDKDAINERVNDGEGVVTDALFGDASRLHTVDGIGYDLDAAKRLLTEAKAAGFDGQVHLVGTNDPLGTETSIAVQAMLTAAGFTVQLDNDQNTTQMISQIITGDFDLVGWGLNVDDSSPWMKLDSHLGAKSPGNYWGLQDPEFEAAITATKTAPTTDELKEATQALQERWNEIVPGAMYASILETVIWHPEVKGIELTQEANVLLAGAYIEG